MAYNNVVYDFLHSKQRQEMNKLSQNGFNQNFVEKFCLNKYKIFTMFMQGNILEKVWRYDLGDGETKGPFTSYDMDIWNGTGNFFGAATWVSFGESVFMPIAWFLNRAPVIEFLVQRHMMSIDHSQRANYQKKNKNQKPPPKRVNFYKKNQQPRTEDTYQPKGTRPDDAPAASPLLAAISVENHGDRAAPRDSNEDFPSLLENHTAAPVAAPPATRGHTQWDDDESDRKSEAKRSKPQDDKPAHAQQPKPGSQEEVTSNLKKMLGL